MRNRLGAQRTWIYSLVSCSTFALAGRPVSAQDPLPSGGELRADQACYDVLYYGLKLRVDPTARSIDGSLTMRAATTTATERFALDLDERLTVHGVEIVGQAQTDYRVDEGRIEIDFDGQREPEREFEVRVRYGGQPFVAPNPPWRGGFTWAKTRAGAPWIATSCQGEGADMWWPCKDHPSDEPRTMDLWIEVPNGLIVATNGTLQSETETADGWRTFHWHVANPINNYGVALNIAPYERLDATYESVAGERVPVQFYVLPEDVARGKRRLPEFLDHLAHLEAVCGPYPFRNEKYGIAQTPHLGMEHQTIIAYGYDFEHQAPGYDWLHHHELSHEWWGNLVTCRDWRDMWIHEGIGTYMQALYVESRFGPEAMQQTMRQQRIGLMNRKPVAPLETQTTHQIYFSTSGNDIYNKGSWIVHSLRFLLGDEVFFRVLRRWAYPDPELEKVTDGSQTRSTDTAEMLAIAEQVSGVELDWFFDAYLHRASLPRIHATVANGSLELRWQAADDLPFPMPIEVEIDGKVRRVEMTDSRATIELGSAEWQLDPAHRILMQRPRPNRRKQ